MVGDANNDVPQDNPVKTTDQVAQKLASESQQGLPDLTRQQSDAAKTNSVQIANQFGDLQITGLDPRQSAQQKAEAAGLNTVLGDQPKDNKPQDNAGDNKPKDVAGDNKPKDNPADNKPKDNVTEAKPKTPEEKAADAASTFEKKAMDGLADKHKDLKVTTDGSPPRAFEPQDKFPVPTEKSAMDIAKDQLGAKATQDQLDNYAMQLMAANDKMGEPGKIKFAAGSEIKLPGQTADGGIVTKSFGETSIHWVDGSSLSRTEWGTGSASFKRPDGTQDAISWNPKNVRGTSEFISDNKNNTEVKIEADGKKTESKFVVTNAQTGDGDSRVTKITSSDSKGRTYVSEFDPPGADYAKKITVTNPDNTQVELTRGRDGKFASADGKTALADNGELYTKVKAADGSETHTFDNGTVEKYDARGRMVHAEGTDGWGRKQEQDYTPGQRQPDTIKITPHPGDKPVELKHHGNKYSGDYVDASGKKVGTVEMANDGRLVYTNDKDKSQHAVLKNGETLDKTVAPTGESKIVYAKGNENIVYNYDKKGHRTDETFTAADGTKITKNFSHDGKELDTVTINDKTGGKTELTYDGHAKAFTGKKTDSTGKVVENVTMLEDKLVFTDVNTGAVRAEKYVPPSTDNPIPKLVPGSYDKNAGTFTYENDEHKKVVESFATGRKDIVNADGTVEGSTIIGDKSAIKAGGEVTVQHSDNSGARLNADGTIDRWGPNKAENANKEKLSGEEDKFLKAHTDIDKRDLVEIHRRLGGDQQKLDKFYTQLEKVDTANNLSDAEKQSLRKDIMHHVAYPAEIYQGRSPSCNVTVVERDMAMKMPDKYAQTIVSAVSDGKITTADGKQIPLDAANLKLADASGRDLASRIFQTTTLQTEFYPHKEFRNSEDGVGRLYPVPFNAADKPEKFEGLRLPNIADVQHKLTGEEKAVTFVNSVDDLVAAYDKGGGPPMIVAVDGSKPPFGEGGPVGAGGNLNHVVTITRIDKSVHPPKIYVQNQWGLSADHSTEETAVPADKLLENMRIRHHGFAGPAMVLGPGDHTKAYNIAHGTPVVDASTSRLVAKAQANPGDKVM